jgi:hypothetical protein
MRLSTRYFVTFVPFCVLFFNKGWVAGGSYRPTGFKTELTQETVMLFRNLVFGNVLLDGCWCFSFLFSSKFCLWDHQHPIL